MRDAIRHKLIHAVTEYDRKQSTRRGYNHYALAHYIAAVDDIANDIAAGEAPLVAIERHTNDRVAEVCRRAIL
jgi:hypothetical protein